MDYQNEKLLPGSAQYTKLIIPDSSLRSSHGYIVSSWAVWTKEIKVVYTSQSMLLGLKSQELRLSYQGCL